MTQWPVEDIVIGPFKGRWRFLSNFHESSLTYGGHRFPTAEHAYQARKAYRQEALFHQIKDADTPGEAKKLGYRARLPQDWDEAKVGFMTEIVTAKFCQNAHLARRLMETRSARNSLIVELNGWGDTYWGAGEDTGEGENHLGRILMGLRDTFGRLPGYP